jgi:hypothetical protein
MKKILWLFASAAMLWNCSDQTLPELHPSKPKASATAARLASPVNVSFKKSLAAPGTWQGEVSGDVSGKLQTIWLNPPGSGKIWHVEFDWIVEADNTDYSFTARLSGILNTNTGKVVMNGKVTEGWLKGAQVHEEGQLTNPETLTFAGTIRIMPATAD